MIRFTVLAVICNLSQHLSQNRSAINIRLRTFVNLVIFPLSLFSDLGPFGQLIIYRYFGNYALQYVPVYIVFHSGIAPISLVVHDVFSHLKKRACIHSNIYKSGISV